MYARTCATLVAALACIVAALQHSSGSEHPPSAPAAFSGTIYAVPGNESEIIRIVVKDGAAITDAVKIEGLSNASWIGCAKNDLWIVGQSPNVEDGRAALYRVSLRSRELTLVATLPHGYLDTTSPAVHSGKFWFVASGALCSVDLESGVIASAANISIRLGTSIVGFGQHLYVLDAAGEVIQFRTDELGAITAPGQRISISRLLDSDLLIGSSRSGLVFTRGVGLVLHATPGEGELWTARAQSVRHGRVRAVVDNTATELLVVGWELPCQTTFMLMSDGAELITIRGRDLGSACVCE